jgi:HPt (histidine-containing phosphotransfer) domain-containing protein
VDYEGLLSRCLGDPGLVSKVAQKFQQTVPQVWDHLCAGIKAGDAAATARHAHSIKGTAGSVSAAQLAELAAQLESLGREGNLATAESVLEQLTTELERCKQELQALASSDRVPPRATSIACSP